MKKRNIIFILSTLTFVCLASIVAIWFFNTWEIKKALTSIKRELAQQEIYLRYDDITFHKDSIFDITADISNITFNKYSKVTNNSQRYKIPSLTINNNLWNKKANLKLAKKITTNSNINNNKQYGEFIFQTKPTVDIQWKSALKGTSFSSFLEHLDHLKLEKVGYTYYQKTNDKMIAVNSIDYITAIISNHSDKNETNADFDIMIDGYQSLLSPELEDNPLSKKIYELSYKKGKSSTTLKFNISGKLGKGIIKDQFTAKIKKLAFLNPNYNTIIAGTLIKNKNSIMPKGDLTIEISNLESFVHQNALAFNMGANYTNHQNNMVLKTLGKKQINQITSLLKQISSTTNAETTVIHIKSDNDKITIGNTNLMEFLSKMQDILYKNIHTYKSKKGAFSNKDHKNVK